MPPILAMTLHSDMTAKRLTVALQVLMLSPILHPSSWSIQPQYVEKYSREDLINNITILQPLESISTVSIVCGMLIYRRKGLYPT